MNGIYSLLTKRVRGFRRFFEMGQDESVSPFLSEEGRKLSKYLSLKISCLSACLLVVAFLCRYFQCEIPVPFLTALIFLFVGSPALIAALQDIFLKKDMNIDVLMTVAAFGSVAIGYPLEGALLLVLFELSQSLEEMVTFRAKSSIVSLGELNPEKALCVDKNGDLVERALEDVTVGQEVVVRSGEVVPIDGVIISGEATCSLAHMTGESRPILFSVGGEAVSGARVIEGYLHVKTTVMAEQSTLAKLIQLITRVHTSKPRLSQVFDRYGKNYAMTIIFLSLGILLFFPFFFGLPFAGELGSFKRAMTFLVTASPCALVLAVPISYVSALGAALKKGAILKGGIVFDQIVDCKVIAFDKTGTLTYGSLEVVEFVRLAGSEEEHRALGYVASLEQYAVHPLAKAIIGYAKGSDVAFSPCQSVVVELGKGIRGEIVDGNTRVSVVVGTFAYLQEMYPGCMREVKIVTLPGESELFIAIDGTSFYVCRLRDTVRQEGKRAVLELQKMQKRVILISGDREEQVEKVAWQLGISEAISEASPQEKLEKVSSLSKEGLVMVGDGLNDAPALAEATVGISMGSVASASAREVSDVILLHDTLYTIPWLFGKSKETRWVVRQNVTLALLAIVAGTIPALFGLIPVWGAVCLHEGSTLLVGLNGLRLLKP